MKSIIKILILLGFIGLMGCEGVNIEKPNNAPAKKSVAVTTTKTSSSNMVVNANFDKNIDGWKSYIHNDAVGNVSYEDGKAKISIEKEGDKTWSVQLYQEGFNLVAGEKYTLKFDVQSTVERKIEITIENKAYERFLDKTVVINKEPKSYSFDFTAPSDQIASLKFLAGKMEREDAIGKQHSIFIDNVSFEGSNKAGNKKVKEKIIEVKGDEMLKNPSFEEAISDKPLEKNWFFFTNNGGSGNYQQKDGMVEIKSTNTSAEDYGVQLIQTPVNIRQKYIYVVTFEAKAEEDRKIHLKIGGREDKQWASYAETSIKLTTKMAKYQYKFTMKNKTDRKARLEFWYAKNGAKVWMKDVSLKTMGEDKNAAIAKKNGGRPVTSDEKIEVIAPGQNAIQNGNFDSGMDNWVISADTSSKAKITVKNGMSVADIQNTGDLGWSIQMEQSSFVLENEKEYSVSFDAKSSVNREIELIVENKNNYTMYLDKRIKLTNKMKKYKYKFTMNDKTDEDVEMLFAMGTVDKKITDSHKVFIDNVEFNREVGKLVWDEEFNYKGSPNPKKWNYVVGGKLFNNEYEYYTDSDKNSYVDGKNLVITARKEKYKNCDYTSARLTTANKGDFLFGRVEVRAKLPIGSGTWPAIWMYPTDNNYGEWPASGEVDIMESVGNEPNIVHASTHTMRYNFMKHNNATESIDVSDGINNKFHTYSMDWLPDRIDMYVDDVLYFRLYNEKDGWEGWPFDQRFNIILNLAVGGDWGAAAGFDPNGWPQKMKIDYVRVYDMDLNFSNDKEAPTEPENITAKTVPYAIPLKWEPSTDNVSVKSYEIYLNNNFVGKSTSTSYLIGNLEQSTKYTVKIRAVDYNGNKSDFTTKEITTSKLEPVKIPSKIEAEDYLLFKGIKTQDTSDEGKGKNVGWIDNGDWMEYVIDVPEDGNYTIKYRISAPAKGGEIEFLVNDESINTVTVPLTGGWQKWDTISTNEVHLNKGIKKIRINAKSGGFNINWFEITK